MQHETDISSSIKGKSSFCIFSLPEETQDGLFGQVFNNIFEILPHLYENNIYPAWDIRASQYGEPPDYVTVPGALDIAYEQPATITERISLVEFRRQQKRVLGNDWHSLSAMWNAYFRVPARIEERADQIMPQGRALGIHYRGHDKLTTTDDSNPTTHEGFLALIKAFLAKRSDFDVIFAATDEFAFVEKLRATVKIPVINLGAVEFHKAVHQTIPPNEKTDRALLDCVLLSRCHCVIETSSALPSFAKVLNPDLEIYRTAASKPFSGYPYFPVAFIPILHLEDPKLAANLNDFLHDDWTLNPAMQKYKTDFSSMKHKVPMRVLLRVAYRVGARQVIDNFVAWKRNRLRASRSE